MNPRPRNSLYYITLTRTIIPLVSLLFSFCIFFAIVISIVASDNAKVLLEHQQERLEDRLAEVEKQLLRIAYRQRTLVDSKQVVKFAYLYDGMEWYTRYEIQNQLKNALLNLTDSNTCVKEAWLYLPSLSKYISSRSALPNAPAWFQPVCDVQGASFFEKDNILYNVVRAGETNDVQPISVVILDKEKINAEIRYSLINENDSIFIFWGQEPPEAQQEKANLIIHGKELNLTTLYYSSDNETHLTKVLITLFGFFVLLSIAAVSLVLIKWHQHIYKPLRRLLVDAFDHAEKGDLSYRITIDKNSPFAVEYQSYNHMMDCMEKYVETNLKQQLLVNQANLKQLQSQISPHFMYNSYYILYRLIKKGDQESSQRLAEYLGQFYHYITRNADDEKRLVEEVEHARVYAQIQKYRFRDALDIDIEAVNESIAKTYVPRLILQPVLENAFKYAYDTENNTGMMKLWVHYRVSTSQCFDIIVENSGMISDETLESIKKRLQNTNQSETTALVNIHRRLQIYFGKHSGIRVSRSELGGLLVCMHIEDDRKDETA